MARPLLMFAVMKRRAPARIERVTRFLYGLRDEDTAAALVAAGMRDEDVERAWALLRATVPRSIESARPAPDTRGVERARDELAKWVRRWAPIVHAALRDPHPDALDLLLGRPPFQHVDDPVVDAHEIVRGVELLAEGTKRVRDARGALERLRARGLTDEEMSRARNAITRALELPAIDGRSGYTSACAHAEAELWNWYLHWSQFALRNVTDKGALRTLGFEIEPVLNQG